MEDSNTSSQRKKALKIKLFKKVELKNPEL